jgi:hypothetical protein
MSPMLCPVKPSRDTGLESDSVDGHAPGTSRATSGASSKAVRRLARSRPHEWVSFDDPDEERVWLFDVTFLASGWKCIYGEGCPGIEAEAAPERAIGCCSHGAHFTDKDDVARVKKYAARLTDSQWQFRGLALAQGSLARGALTKDEATGDTVTRVHDGACIFLNRPGFPGGPGCALHRAAIDAGDQPLEWKPEVCWQVPIRREDHDQPDGSVLSIVGEWARSHWGEGGHDFGWWCTEEASAFQAPVPVYVHSEAELTALTSAKVYSMLATYLDERTGRKPVQPSSSNLEKGPSRSDADGARTRLRSDGGGRALLPHPALRPR